MKVANLWLDEASHVTSQSPHFQNYLSQKIKEEMMSGRKQKKISFCWFMFGLCLYSPVIFRPPGQACCSNALEAAESSFGSEFTNHRNVFNESHSGWFSPLASRGSYMKIFFK
ncbi:hypothetical protein CRENBAI_025796 [Crenichthys baileyi]|uniref:Uncharacterized protein n=1 Tax=Crenichthys baileyi TaxID=28760 RepID=A0AAV9SDP8_9TELE